MNNVYALFVDGYFIKAVVGPNDAVEMLYRFLSGLYYRIFVNNPDYRLSFEWLTMYCVRVYKRNINSISLLPIFIGQTELRRLHFAIDNPI